MKRKELGITLFSVAAFVVAVDGKPAEQRSGKTDSAFLQLEKEKQETWKAIYVGEELRVRETFICTPTGELR